MEQIIEPDNTKRDIICVDIETPDLRNKNKRTLTALLDSGANTCIISEKLVRQLGLKDNIIPKVSTVSSFTGAKSKFVGLIQLEFNIGPHVFQHVFQIITPGLGTRTDLLLGIDFLCAAEITLQFKPEGPVMTLRGQDIPVKERMRRIIDKGQCMINYVVRPQEEPLECPAMYAKATEYKKLNPGTATVVKLVLPGSDWPEFATLERTKSDRLLIEEQIVTVRKHEANPKAKCKTSCKETECIIDCPTIYYFYALSLVYNPSSRPIYLTPGEVVAKVEPQYINDDLTTCVNNEIDRVNSKIERESNEARTAAAESIVNMAGRLRAALNTTAPANANTLIKKKESLNKIDQIIKDPSNLVNEKLNRDKEREKKQKSLDYLRRLLSKNTASRPTDVADQSNPTIRNPTTVVNKAQSIQIEKLKKPTDIVDQSKHQIGNPTSSSKQNSPADLISGKRLIDIARRENHINEIGFLDLDPIKDSEQYRSEYLKKHKPPIPLNIRKTKIKEVIDRDFADIPIQAKNLLLKYPETVHLDNIPFVGSKVVAHRIAYTGPVFWNRQYRTPRVLEKDIQAEIDRLIEEGIIEPTESEFNNAILPVAKYDRESGKLKLRIVCDLRTLNKNIVIDKLKIADINELLTKLEGVQYITVIDAASGYLQIPLTQDSKKYTAFRFNNHAFCYRKLAFGLGSAPSSYIRMMNIILSGIPNAFCYMDDVILFNFDLKSHLETLETVLKRFSYHGLELSLKKSHFIKTEVEYLGFKVTREGLKPSPKLLEPMLNAKLPTTLKEARSLCSTFSFYRRFIKNFAAIIEPLINLTRNHGVGKGDSTPVQPNEQCAKALDKLKSILRSEVCLKYPNFNKPFIVTSDGSLDGLGAHLSQLDSEGHQRPVAFASRSLHNAEKKSIRPLNSSVS